ncbi:MAG: hypothetical protein WBW61_04785 [Rhodanobacteraceae bacterium]
MLTEKLSEPQITPRMFERILAVRGNLIALRVSDVTRTIAQCRQVALRGGQAIYLWQPGSGLVSLRDADVEVPAGHGLADALQHVLHSIHFGIYLFDGFETQMRSAALRLLRRIARASNDNERKLVFIAEKFAFAREIEAEIEYMNLPAVTDCQPRLRDGHWVV